MSTPLNERLRAAAAADAGLQSLLGADPFRLWFDVLRQGSQLPAVVMQQISGPTTYTAEHRLATGWTRQQFTIWGGENMAGQQARAAVAAALKTFFDQWDGGTGISGLSLYPNRVDNERDIPFVEKTAPVYRRILDVMIFSDDRL